MNTLVIYNVHFFLLSLEISDWWVYILKCDVTIVDEELIIHTCPWRLWDWIMNSNGILSHQTYCNIEICLVWRAFSQNRLHSYPLSNVGQWYVLFLFQWIRSIFTWTRTANLPHELQRSRYSTEAVIYELRSYHFIDIIELIKIKFYPRRT